MIDVAALECDFLACSTYKFFGPHMGVLYGKREHLQRIRPYKVRPNTNAIPELLGMGHAQSRMHRRNHRLRGISRRSLGGSMPQHSGAAKSGSIPDDAPRSNPPTLPSTSTSASCWNAWRTAETNPAPENLRHHRPSPLRRALRHLCRSH